MSKINEAIQKHKDVKEGYILECVKFLDDYYERLKTTEAQSKVLEIIEHEGPLEKWTIEHDKDISVKAYDALVNVRESNHYIYKSTDDIEGFRGYELTLSRLGDNKVDIILQKSLLPSYMKPSIVEPNIPNFTISARRTYK